MLSALLVFDLAATANNNTTSTHKKDPVTDRVTPKSKTPIVIVIAIATRLR